MKKVLSAVGVCYVIDLAKRHGIEPSKLIDVFNEIAPEEDDEENVKIVDVFS